MTGHDQRMGTAFVIAFYVLSFLLVALGLIRAYWMSTSSLRTSKKIRAAVEEITAREDAERNKLMAAGSTQDERDALELKYTKEREAAGGKTVTLGEVFIDRVTVSPEPFAVAVRENRWNFLFVGVGTLCATVASIWSLCL